MQKLVIIFLVLFLAGAACRFSAPAGTPEPAAPTEILVTPEILIRETVVPTPTTTVKVVQTNTPKSYPSSLQSWLIGRWQQVNTGAVYHFTSDYEMIQLGEPNIVLGAYRFEKEDQLQIPWQNGVVWVEVWQLDLNSMLLTFPNGVGEKFIRVRY